MTINTYLSIITLNVKGLNAPIRKQGGGMDKKQIYLYAAYKTLISDLKTHTHTQKMKGWKNIYLTNGSKTSGAAVLISEKK